MEQLHNAGDLFQFAGAVLLAVVAFFLRRSFNQLEGMEKALHTLDKKLAVVDTKIAVILTHDRRKRLADYENGDSENGEG